MRMCESQLRENDLWEPSISSLILPMSQFMYKEDSFACSAFSSVNSWPLLLHGSNLALHNLTQGNY